MKMQLGISSYTYTWAVGVPGSHPPAALSAYDLVDKAGANGLKLVQIADNLPLEGKSADHLLDLKNYANSRGVSIELGSRGLTKEHTFRCLEAAEILQSPILRMVIDGPGYEPDLKSINNIILELLPEFRSRKIKLAIENHDRFKACEFAEIILSAASEWVGICLDSVNSMGAGEGFDEVSKTLIPYTINLHIKDFMIKRVSHRMGIIIEGAPAGKGMLNISQLVCALSQMNRCHSAILELWTPPERTIEETVLKEEKWASESVDFLKHIFI